MTNLSGFDTWRDVRNLKIVLAGLSAGLLYGSLLGSEDQDVQQVQHLLESFSLEENLTNAAFIPEQPLESVRPLEDNQDVNSESATEEPSAPARIVPVQVGKDVMPNPIEAQKILVKYLQDAIKAINGGSDTLREFLRAQNNIKDSIYYKLGIIREYDKKWVITWSDSFRDAQERKTQFIVLGDVVRPLFGSSPFRNNKVKTLARRLRESLKQHLSDEGRKGNYYSVLKEDPETQDACYMLEAIRLYLFNAPSSNEKDCIHWESSNLAMSVASSCCLNLRELFEIDGKPVVAILDFNFEHETRQQGDSYCFTEIGRITGEVFHNEDDHE